MRHGITILPEHTWAEAAPLWRDAEAMGFDHAWTYDHLVWGGLVGVPWFAAVPTLAAAAGVTSTIDLGTFVSSPNYRHPYTFARDVLTLDDLSGGRFLCGLGTGGDLDSSIIGGDHSLGERVQRFHEFVPLLDRLLREDHVNHVGTWFTTRDARTRPAPVRDRVPFCIAANGPKSVRLAATLGDAWVTYGGKGATLDDWFAHVATLVARFEGALAGGDRGPVARVLSLDASPRFALESAELYAEMVGRADELGFTDVVTHWPRPDGPYAGDPAVLEEVASTILGPRPPRPRLSDRR